MEIEEKIAERERKKLSEERTRMAQELRDEARKNALRLKAETDKRIGALISERDAASSRVKELQAREAAVRKEAIAQAEARMKSEIDKKVAAAITERERASETKLKQLEAAKKAELEQQRAALEKDRDSQLLKLQSQQHRERDQIYAYITSEAYRQHQAEAQRLTTDILDLDVEEQRTHGKVWQARGKMATRLRNAVREIDTEVSAILEGRTSHT